MLTIFAKIDHFGQTNSDEHKTLKLIRILFEPKNPANGFEKKKLHENEHNNQSKEHIKQNLKIKKKKKISFKY